MNTTSCFRFAFLILFLASAAGCGLKDYEGQMELERRRIKQFDDEEAFLTGPIDAPPERKIKTKAKEESKPAWPFDIFLRPPTNFSREPVPTVYAFNNVLLYRYPCMQLKKELRDGTLEERPGWNLFVAASKIGEMNKEKVFAEGELSRDEFRRRIRGCLKEFYRQTYKVDIEFADAKTEKYEIPCELFKVLGKPPESVILEFEKLKLAGAGKDPEEFWLFFKAVGVDQAVVVFQAPKSAVADPLFQRDVDFSLKSLDFGPEASEKRRIWITSRRPKKS